MTESERMLARQAAWQKSRQALSWPEKIRQAERIRPSIEEMRKQRQTRRRQDVPPAGNSGRTTPA
jgi:hypothetical protein